MRAPSPRERWLFAATLGAGLLVVASHGGVPLSCSSTTQSARTMAVSARLEMDQKPNLWLTSKVSSSGVSIPRGTVLRLYLLDKTTEEGALIGFDPSDRTVLLEPTREVALEIPVSDVRSIAVASTGGSSNAGTGALLGGLTGLALGAGLGSTQTSGSGSCAVSMAVPGALLGGLLGTGVGAGVGAATASGDEPQEYELGPGKWQVAAEPEPPKSKPPEKLSQPFATLPGIAGPAHDEPDDAPAADPPSKPPSAAPEGGAP